MNILTKTLIEMEMNSCLKERESLLTEYIGPIEEYTRHYLEWELENIENLMDFNLTPITKDLLNLQELTLMRYYNHTDDDLYVPMRGYIKNLISGNTTQATLYKDEIVNLYGLSDEYDILQLITK